MKIFLFVLFTVASLGIFTACQNRTAPKDNIESTAGSQSGVPAPYKPGLGEFMLNIQMHHNKLWFAGQAENWPLAKFEEQEIEETLQDIRDYCKDRDEVKSLGMITPAIDSMGTAIDQKNRSKFNATFSTLTNTCNNCHVATNHAFNVIKTPSSPIFTNQEYKP